MRPLDTQVFDRARIRLEKYLVAGSVCAKLATLEAATHAALPGPQHKMNFEQTTIGSGQRLAKNQLFGMPGSELQRRPVVALLLYENIGPFHLAGPLLVFGYSGFGTSCIDIRMCAVAPGMIHTLAGFDINATGDLEALTKADAVVVPGWHSVDTPVAAPLKQALHKAHALGAHIVGLCLGVFVLAGAGLLAGRRATTHWARVPLLAERHPDIRLQPDVLYPVEDRLWTSAGGASAIDICLQLLRKLCGPAVATEVARRIVSAPQREGAQQQRLGSPIVRTDVDRKVRGTLDWVSLHLHEAIGLEAAAARTGLSVRAFTRHFRRITGTTYGQWQLHQRLLLAQQLLHGTDHTVEEIAEKVGFATGTSLRQHFRRRFGQTPGQYREAAPSHGQHGPDGGSGRRAA